MCWMHSDRRCKQWYLWYRRWSLLGQCYRSRYGRLPSKPMLHWFSCWMATKGRSYLHPCQRLSRSSFPRGEQVPMLNPWQPWRIPKTRFEKWLNFTSKAFSGCIEKCTDSQCNGGDFVELGEQLSAGKKVASCHHCSYIERDDGSTDGDDTCRDNADSPKACPSYATVSSSEIPLGVKRSDLMHKFVFSTWVNSQWSPCWRNLQVMLANWPPRGAMLWGWRCE